MTFLTRRHDRGAPLYNQLFLFLINFTPWSQWPTSPQYCVRISREHVECVRRLCCRYNVHSLTRARWNECELWKCKINTTQWLCRDTFRSYLTSIIFHTYRNQKCRGSQQEFGAMDDGNDAILMRRLSRCEASFEGYFGSWLEHVEIKITHFALTQNEQTGGTLSDSLAIR